MCECLVRLKQRCQFSGWLQYLPNLVIVIILFIFLMVIYFITGHYETILFLVVFTLCCIFLIILIIDIITVRFMIRPFTETKPSNGRHKLSIFEIMRLRRSCRSFQKNKLSQSDISTIMNLIKKQTISTIRFEYISGPVAVWPVCNAKEFIVAIAPAQYNRQSVIDVGHYLQKIVLAATKIDIATCWIGPGASHASVIKYLGPKFDENKDHIICLCAIGYHSIYTPLMLRAMEWVNSSNCCGRLPLNKLFFDGDSQIIKKEMFSHEPFLRLQACFEGCRWSPSAFNSQPTRCVIITDYNNNELKIMRLDFYVTIHSRYYAPVALGIWMGNFELGCKELVIDGYFKKLELLESEQIKENNEPFDLVKYDMSWIMT